MSTAVGPTIRTLTTASCLPAVSVQAARTPYMLPLLLLPLLLSGASACQLAYMGNALCTPGNCSYITGDVSYPNSGLSFWVGGLGGINYQFFSNLATPAPSDKSGANTGQTLFQFLTQGQTDYMKDCCGLCANTLGCSFWRFFPAKADDIPAFHLSSSLGFKVQDIMNGGTWPVVYPRPFPNCGFDAYGGQTCGTGTNKFDPNGGNCVLFKLVSNDYRDKKGTVCAGPSIPGCYAQANSAWLPTQALSVNATTGLINAGLGIQTAAVGKPRSYWGGTCNPGTDQGNVVDDPHFVGADGVRFDFNGEIGRSFCLVSDVALHVNMEIGGFFDTRRQYVQPGEKALRSWIIGMNFMWKSHENAAHSLVLRTRKGMQDARRDGFLASVELDGMPVELPTKVGDGVIVDGLSLKLEEQTKKGPYDMDVFSVTVSDTLYAKLNVRAAHPLLRSESEAYVHFNLIIKHLEPSPHIHGVLGQTFRQDSIRVTKSLEYKLLSTLLGESIKADRESGAGYLDGSVKDYITSSLTAPDCKFSQWQKA